MHSSAPFIATQRESHTLVDAVPIAEEEEEEEDEEDEEEEERGIRAHTVAK